MTQLRCEMSKIMQLRDLSVHTQRSSLSAVSGLARHYNMPPDKISKTMVEDYLLYLKNAKKQVSNGVGTIVSGLKFLYKYVLSNEENTPEYAQRSTRRLPVVLTPEEVLWIINAPKNLKHRLMLKTTYSAGLRASEVIILKPGDIESDRMLIKVEGGKGKKDRYTLLSVRLLKGLRHSRFLCRHPLAVAVTNDHRYVQPNFQNFHRQLIAGRS